MEIEIAVDDASGLSHEFRESIQIDCTIFTCACMHSSEEKKYVHKSRSNNVVCLYARNDMFADRLCERNVRVSL